MRVLFVFPDLSSTVTHYTGALSYGVAALSASLRREGHQTALYHITDPPSGGEFRARVRAERPDLVAFSSNSHYARRLREWTAWAREATGAPVAVGGVHATLATEEVAALPAVDFTCVGEGEQALTELCAALGSGADPSRIASLWVRTADGVARNPVRPIARDLDALPDPDLSLFAVDRLYDARRGIFTYAMSRGCAYRCTYCCVHALRDLAGRPRGYWRFLSPARAADQLAELIARHLPRARRVSFTDAILFPDREWLAEFVPLYRKRVGLPFSCNLRADRVDDDTARLLREMGCVIARMGVESGDEAITSEVLHRSLELDDIRRAFALLRSHGIARWSYNMVGLPTETLRASLRTVRLNAEIDPDLALAFIFYPYPGTALRKRCEESGYLTDREFDTYKVATAIHMPQFPESDILFVHRFFNALIRLHARARRLPGRLRAPAAAALDALVSGRLLPRRAIVGSLEGYRSLRHSVGEYLVRRSPALYRALGGRDAVRVGVAATPSARPRAARPLAKTEVMALADVPGEAYARLAGDSFFASRGFLELWRARGGRPVVWAAEAGGAIAALLPGVEYGHAPWLRFASLPDGCYGGLFVDPALEARRPALARALLAALARRGYARCDIFDYHATLPAHEGFAPRRGEARLIDIAGPDWAPPDRKLRAQIRKARREGIHVEPFDWDRHHEGFLKLVARTYAHHGLAPRYPADFYRALAGLAARDARVQWRWCEHGGRPACSHIYFAERGVLQAWQSYFDRTFSFLKPNAYIRFTLCREMAGRGVAWLNLGATPEGAAGLAYYKGRWGGRRVSFDRYRRAEGLGRLLDHEALAEALRPLRARLSRRHAVPG